MQRRLFSFRECWPAMLLLPAFLTPSAAVDTCAGCHALEAREQAGSAHAQGLKTVKESLFFKSLPDRPIGEARGGFLLDFRMQGAVVEVTAQRGMEKSSALVEWVFGAGRRGETPVLQMGPQMVESRISYYSGPDKFDLTFGHQRGVSASAKDALGLVQSKESTVRCFGCHGENGVPGSAGFRAGVHCDSCHSTSGQHPGGAMTNGGHLNQRAVLKLCGTCHRAEPEGDPDGLVNVRYQAVRLERSRCFRAGTLSCVTCHNPHTNARADSAWYRERCLECHGKETHAASMEGTDCLGCHMPCRAITTRLAFTDHWIRKKP